VLVSQVGRRRWYAVVVRRAVLVRAPVSADGPPQPPPRPRARLPLPRRGHSVEPPWFQAPPNSWQVVLSIVRQRRPLIVPPRRRTAAPIPLDQLGPLQLPLRLRARPPLPRRGHSVEPPWFQAPPNSWQVVLSIVRQPRPLIVQPRRRAAAPIPLDQLAPLAPWRPRRLLPALRRRAVQSAPLDQPQAPAAVRIRRPLAVAIRRARPPDIAWLQAAAPVNPAFIEWVRRRVLQRSWMRPPRGRAMEAPWGQAIPPPNPAFVDPGRRVVRAQLLRIRSSAGRSLLPPWGQAAAPDGVVYRENWIFMDGVVRVDGSHQNHIYVSGILGTGAGRVWVDGQGQT
jgi:hypothetical protein